MTAFPISSILTQGLWHLYKASEIVDCSPKIPFSNLLEKICDSCSHAIHADPALFIVKEGFLAKAPLTAIGLFHASPTLCARKIRSVSSQTATELPEASIKTSFFPV